VGLTLKFGALDGGSSPLFVLVYAALSPTDEEWQTQLDSRVAYSRSVSAVRCVIVTDESAPSPRQRKMLEDATRPYQAGMRVAVVSGSTFVGGVVTAFRTAHPGYRTFEPHDLDRALAYVDASSNRFASIRRQVDEWRMILALPPLPVR
jgi:hypothetical protein